MWPLGKTNVIGGGLSMEKYSRRGQNTDQRGLQGSNSVTGEVDEWLSRGCEHAFFDEGVERILSNYSLWNIGIYTGDNDKEGQIIIWREGSCVHGCDKR